MTSILGLPSLPVPSRRLPQRVAGSAAASSGRSSAPCLGLALTVSGGLWVAVGYVAVTLLA